MQEIINKTSEQYWHKLTEVAELSQFDIQSQYEIKRTLGLSDFIAEQVIRHPEWLELALLPSPELTSKAAYQASLIEQLNRTSSETEAQSIIRRFRHRHMVHIAWLDLNNKQDIKTSLQQVSDLADAIIVATYHWLYTLMSEKYGTPQGEHGDQPLLIIAMGKLGGRELNFSSDIDLIFTYPEVGETSGGRKPLENQTFFTRLGQKLITALNQTTVDGQAFRVDMRLRPFGDSGPLVTHFAALEDYYQEQGREWERYAMVKARVLNDETPYADNLNTILKPFVFRRYIDFGVIDSLRQMKQLIQQEVRRRKLNNNIKLGKGGIREVEFIVQCFQLIRGGRETELQGKSLLQTLKQIGTNNILPADIAEQLETEYLYLRKIEHCLQQFADKQTQDLPLEALNQQRLAEVMGKTDFFELLQQIDQCMAFIGEQFEQIIGDSEEDEDDSSLNQLKDLWTLELAKEEATELLQGLLPESQQETCIELVQSFQQDVAKKPIGTRGADTLDKLIPALLLQVIEHAPEKISDLLPRVFNVVNAILQRTAYLELLVENKGALNQLVKLCDASLWIAQQIQQFPILLDELLDPSSLYNPTPTSQFAAMLRQTLLRVPQDDLELQMETLRQFKLSQQLRIAAADVTGVLPVMKVSDHLTALAETIIAETVQMAWQQMTERYGYPDGASDENKLFAIVAYGKLGGIELGYGSDLDLVFLHQCDSNADTNGKKSIESRQFYIKLTQRIVHIFTTKTMSGDLYEVDMRLRPSGNSGLLVSHINAFEQYQHEEAWTWEHQALVRSRFIYGDTELQKRFLSIRSKILRKPRTLPELQKDITEMREKMRQHLNKGNVGQFDLKQDIGGIADIEFLVQYWVLAHSHQHAELVQWSDNVRILAQLAELNIISQAQQAILNDSYLAYRNFGHRLALESLSALDNSQQFQQQRSEVETIWKSTFQ
ncbi:bifunctional [glutamate--ammonia ligase]-adenylyl-L-tyrosine phosphorylase/[glutamate--ammonia-ligase] adenylyltransferase [Paraneptunicella aestuarii]|uniref:bifunctional [glutamate--ammonia ligase]-adenylyl-L-tyrosine phosphorylase/[glutamate--ammonia-ligase] adenylyltransferase n=1 Tax=Paraneptunicella aestuarii TaxID=2831148 RepID=UPI001E2EA1DC|nr:bifunctional [glutamate--ammonia ligase]-adenylyl-L-tyrosine phosphorylase/[glutamate--ammonia-ligase] adenylyltransferase [Paraneptunicella aestuarii]UAA37665.1 bifunctional [glutamate--ammonia ligase]-adenylyl-L-tyrosine phosphorylase/[glutamate--ammonia-ligase] adenylyltransferase [Paraneptunicella aestuarii]